jgi:hypothetical protein
LTTAFGIFCDETEQGGEQVEAAVDVTDRVDEV